MRGLANWVAVAALVLLPAAVQAQREPRPAGAGQNESVPRLPMTPPAGGWSAGGWNPDLAATPPVGAAQPPRPANPAPAASRPGEWVGQGRWGHRANWGGYRGAYGRPQRGYRLPRYYVAPRFFIPDWRGYGLSDPGYGRHWIRYYDDAVLVDGDGTIHDSRYGLDWDRYNYGPVPYYVGDEGEDDAVVPGNPVTYPVTLPSGEVYHVPPGSTVIIESAPSGETTTTTTTYTNSYTTPRRARPRIRR